MIADMSQDDTMNRNEVWWKQTCLEVADVPLAQVVFVFRYCGSTSPAEQDFSPSDATLALDPSGSCAAHTWSRCELLQHVEIGVWDVFASTQASDGVFQKSDARGIMPSLLFCFFAVNEHVNAYRRDSEGVDQVWDISCGHDETR